MYTLFLHEKAMAAFFHGKKKRCISVLQGRAVKKIVMSTLTQTCSSLSFFVEEVFCAPLSVTSFQITKLSEPIIHEMWLLISVTIVGKHNLLLQEAVTNQLNLI